MSISDFTMIEKLGHGGYSVVYLAVRKSGKQEYAVKIMEKPGIIEKHGVSSVRQERQIMSILNSSFIVKLFYSF